MRISIIMAYHNRRRLLINTLRSISFFNDNNVNLEIIIVDDGSCQHENIADIEKMFLGLNIKVISIRAEDKKWINPCVPFNIGFSYATGEVIIMQNPECLHLFDIVRYVEQNIMENSYLVFGCYALCKDKTDRINDIDYERTKYIKDINNVIVNFKDIRYGRNKKIKNHEDKEGWYQHSRFRPDNLHFCSAVLKKDLDDLGGFDDRFARGVGKDDREFINRIKRKKMQISAIDDLFVVHQYHSVNANTMSEDTNRNNLIFERTKSERTYKISQNPIFTYFQRRENDT